MYHILPPIVLNYSVTQLLSFYLTPIFFIYR